MFYPKDALRKGGRFNLLWIADSCPVRFEKVISNGRRLWTQDIRELCDQLREVVESESGHPSRRYSLRLSSQLLRGLVRLYQRKVQSVYNNMFITYGKLLRFCNGVGSDELPNSRAARVPRKRRSWVQAIAAARAHEQPEPRGEAEARLEEILQSNANIVARIDDITLRETTIPEVVPPPNDNFGEEHPDQAVIHQLAIDRTIETMLASDKSAQQPSSAHLLAPSYTDTSHDVTRPVQQAHLEMSRISANDLTLLRPSFGGRLSTSGIEKEVPAIPDVSLLQIPEMPNPQEKPQEANTEGPEGPNKRARVDQTRRESLEMELEELEEIAPRRKRPKRLIVDKQTSLSSAFIKSRINEPRVDTWLQDSRANAWDKSIIKVKLDVPFDVYMNRPGCAGHKLRSYIALPLTRMYMRNLGYIHRDTPHRDLEVGAMRRGRTTGEVSYQERNESAVEGPAGPALEHITTREANLPAPEVDMSKDTCNVSEQPLVLHDISELVTQRLNLSQTDRENAKRTSDGDQSNAKRVRSARHGSLREIDINVQEPQDLRAGVDIQPVPMQTDKENVPEMYRPMVSGPSSNVRRLTQLLQEAGLADVPVVMPDMPPQGMDTETQMPRVPTTDRTLSSDESQLGSLDRTKVSLGNSESTTDSTRFIQDQWGVEKTFLKIYHCVKDRRDGERITVESLIERGPIIREYKNIIMAKCFSSILKLKQNGFIKITKYPDSLEIFDISLGPKTSFME